MKNFKNIKNISRIISLLTVFVAITSCGVGPRYEDTAPSEVVSSIRDGAINVAINSAISIDFAKALAAGTISSSSIFIVPVTATASTSKETEGDYSLCNPANAIASTITLTTSTNVNVKPDANLECASTYNLCITSDVMYEDGNRYPGKAISFTTAACAASDFTVGGSVSGYTSGDTLVLQNNSTDDYTVTADGAFTFATKIADGAAYLVTVKTQPTGKTCSVASPSGTIAGANVTNVVVTCSTLSYNIGGTVTGFTGGDTLVLQDNGIADLTITANGSFVFATKVAYGSAYAVTVLSHPTTKLCTVTNGSGTTTADVENVEVACSALTVPSVSDVTTALALNNTYGMVPTLSLGEITLPACTASFALTYSLVDCPTWLTFNTTTRAITLKSGSEVPADAYTAAPVTLKCASSADATTYGTVDFTINDLDQGGVVDGYEYLNSYVPMMNSQGYIRPNFSNAYLYLGSTSSPFKIPTSIALPTVGMDPTNAVDDTEDFDGDGTNNDVEITDGTNIFAGTVSDGNFGFGAAITTSVGDAPRYLAIAHLNDDSNLDIAVANYNDGTATVLFGDGDGSFTNSTTLTVGERASGVAIADFYENGFMNVAVSDPYAYPPPPPPPPEPTLQPTIVTFENDGSGNFQAGAGSAGYPLLEQINAVLIDSDSEYVDIYMYKNYTADMPVDFQLGRLVSTGDGLFEFPFPSPFVTSGYTQGDYVEADFNDDGLTDVALAEYTNEYLNIYLQNGSGAYDITKIDTGTYITYGVSAGDFNNDGYLDLVVTLPSFGGIIRVYLGNGTGAFSSFMSISPVTYLPHHIISADYNGDGLLDFAALNMNNDKVSVYLNDGDGTFTEELFLDAPTGVYTFASGDFNNDGYIDMVTVGNGSDDISVFLNDGNAPK